MMRSFVLLIMVLILVSGCVETNRNEINSDSSIDVVRQCMDDLAQSLSSQPEVRYAPGEIVVEFKTGINKAAAEDLIGTYEARIKKDYRWDSGSTNTLVLSVPEGKEINFLCQFRTKTNFVENANLNYQLSTAEDAQFANMDKTIMFKLYGIDLLESHISNYLSSGNSVNSNNLNSLRNDLNSFSKNSQGVVDDILIKEFDNVDMIHVKIYFNSSVNHSEKLKSLILLQKYLDNLSYVRPPSNISTNVVNLVIVSFNGLEKEGILAKTHLPETSEVNTDFDSYLKKDVGNFSKYSIAVNGVDVGQKLELSNSIHAKIQFNESVTQEEKRHAVDEFIKFMESRWYVKHSQKDSAGEYE